MDTVILQNKKKRMKKLALLEK